MNPTHASLLLLALGACAAPQPIAGASLSSDSGLREIRVEAFGLE